MAKIQCEQCDVTSVVTADTQEPVSFCPFCGADINIPTDDTDGDDDYDDTGNWDDDEDDDDEDDDY